jgi:hypothetical protein
VTLAAAFRIDSGHGCWWFAFDVLVILAPLAGAVVPTWWTAPMR